MTTTDDDLQQLLNNLKLKRIHQILARDLDSALVRKKPGDRFEQCRLAGPIRT